jgi:hypothetical protein
MKVFCEPPGSPDQTHPGSFSMIPAPLLPFACSKALENWCQIWTSENQESPTKKFTATNGAHMSFLCLGIEFFCYVKPQNGSKLSGGL